MLTAAALFVGCVKHSLHAPLFTTLGPGLLFTAGLSPDRYAMECKFPVLLGCWEAVYLWFG